MIHSRRTWWHFHDDSVVSLKLENYEEQISEAVCSDCGKRLSFPAPKSVSKTDPPKLMSGLSALEADVRSMRLIDDFDSETTAPWEDDDL